VCEIWDLRQSMTPKMKLENFHTGSILGLDWNPHDSHLLLTTGEDQRIGVWDPINGHLLTEYSNNLPTQTNIYDITWNPNQKGIFATCSYDQQSKVSIQSLSASGDHVPSWLKKPAGASLAFGGKFARVTEIPVTTPAAVAPATAASPASASSSTSAISTSISVSTLSLEPQLLTLAQEFLEVFSRGDFVAFCDHKREISQSADDRQIWTFMKILYEDQTNQRLLLLKELGFKQPETKIDETENNKSLTENHLNGTASTGHHQQQQQSHNNTNHQNHEISEDQFFDTFDDNLSLNSSNVSENSLHTANGVQEEAKTETNDISPPVPATATNASNEKELPIKPKKIRPISDEFSYTLFSSSDDDEALIREALLYGDFKTAVDQCLSSGRLADAIVFSSFGPPSLWEETRAAYFNSHPHPFIKNSMRQVSTGQFDELVLNSQIDHDEWKQTLAIIITYTNSEKYRGLVNLLGERLETSGMTLPALICYMCCSNVDKAVELFSKSNPSNNNNNNNNNNNDPVLAFHHSMEKIAVFAHATQAHTLNPPSQLLSLKYSEYATMLANQGVFYSAWNYLRLSNPYNNDIGSQQLLDRIFHASYTTNEPIQSQTLPVFPFNVVRVDADPALMTVNAQYENNKRARINLVQQTLVHHQQPTTGTAPVTTQAPPPQQQPINQQQQAAHPQYAQHQQPSHPQSQQPSSMYPPSHQTPQRPGQQQQPSMARPGAGQPPMPQSSHAHQTHQSHGQQQPFYHPGQQPQQHQQPPAPFNPQSAMPQHQPPQAQHQQQYPTPQTPQQPQLNYARDPRAIQQPLPPTQPQQPMPNQQYQFHQQSPVTQPMQPPMPAARGAYNQPQQPANAPYGQQAIPPTQPPVSQAGHYQHPSTPQQPQRVQPQQFGTSQPNIPPPSQQQHAHLPHQQQPMAAHGQPSMPNVPYGHSQPQQSQQPPLHNQQPLMPSPQQRPQQQQPSMPFQPQQHQQPSPTNGPLILPSQMQQQSQPTAAPLPAAAAPRIFNPAISQTPGPAPMAAHSQPNPTTPGPPSSHAQSQSHSQSQSFDPSSFQVSPEFQSTLSTLESLVSQLRSRVVGGELKKLTDQHSKLSALYSKLSPTMIPSLSQSLISSLQLLTQCLLHGDYNTAIKTHINSLVRNDWTGNNDWIMPLKTILEMAKKHLIQTQ